MVNWKALGIGVLGLMLVFSGVFLWTSGFESTLLGATRHEWSPLLWFIGIIVLLSMGLVYCLTPKYYFGLIALFIVGFVALFYIMSIVLGFIVP